MLGSNNLRPWGGQVNEDSIFTVIFSKIEIKLYTKQGALKDSTDCAPNNGYYLIPVYDKGEYVIKVGDPGNNSILKSYKRSVAQASLYLH